MKSLRGSFVNHNGSRGFSFTDKHGFGSFRNAHGSFMGGSSSGHVDDGMDSPSDSFLMSTGDPSLSFSFTGRNGSFRSPSALGVPIVLGSYTGQSFGAAAAGKSFGGMSYNGKSFTGSSANWGHVKSNIMQKEADFCKDFMCCGQDLGNLHDLLEHYEEAHVVVVNSPGINAKELEMDPDSRWAYGGGVDELDVEMEALDEESPSSGSETCPSTAQTSPAPGHAVPGLVGGKAASTAVATALNRLALDDVLKSNSTTAAATASSAKSEEISAFDSFVVSSASTKPVSSTKPKSTNLAASRRALNGGINNHHGTTHRDTKNAFGLNVRRQSPEPTKTTTGFTAVAPNVLFTNSTTPSPVAQAATPVAPTAAAATAGPSTTATTTTSDVNASPVPANSTPVGWKAPAQATVSTDVTPQASLFSTHRPFRCPQPGCQKSYKQANGLKYHMLKGQCNFEVRDAMEWAGLSQEEAEERAKPYACAAGDGCNKRYRQANGLKVGLRVSMVTTCN